MTIIAQVLAVQAMGSGYYDDLAALQASHVPISERFTAHPRTPGFRAVRQVAEVVSVGLVLGESLPHADMSGPDLLDEAALDLVTRTGRVAWGDCVAVAYGGKSGRDPLFRSAEGVASILRAVVPALAGRRLTSFRELAEQVEARTEMVEVEQSLPVEPRSPHKGGVSRRALVTAPARLLRTARRDEPPTEKVSVERRLHTAIRYGVSQALLRAVAMARGLTMAEIIAEEWDLPLPAERVPIHAQSGSERRLNADKMIVRHVASLPHALVDDISGQFGSDGSELTRYIRWLRQRIPELGGPDYRPTIHLDVHGALGQVYNHELGRMLGQLYAWELAAQPYPLRIESPMVMDSRQAQIEAMGTLREYIRLRKMKVQLVADEWANTLEDIRAFIDAEAADMIQIKMPDLGGIHNTVEAVLACQAGGAAAFLGGSYVETEISSRVAVHVALATRPDIVMARPGMGVDEALSLTQNEMARTLAQVRIA